MAGLAAKQGLIRNAGNTVRHVKDTLGQAWSDLQKYAKDSPVRVRHRFTLPFKTSYTLLSRVFQSMCVLRKRPCRNKYQGSTRFYLFPDQNCSFKKKIEANTFSQNILKKSKLCHLWLVKFSQKFTWPLTISLFPGKFSIQSEWVSCQWDAFQLDAVNFQRANETRSNWTRPNETRPK